MFEYMQQLVYFDLPNFYNTTRPTDLNRIVSQNERTAGRTDHRRKTSDVSATDSPKIQAIKNKPLNLLTAYSPPISTLAYSDYFGARKLKRACNFETTILFDLRRRLGINRILWLSKFCYQIFTSTNICYLFVWCSYIV